MTKMKYKADIFRRYQFYKFVERVVITMLRENRDMSTKELRRRILAGELYHSRFFKLSFVTVFRKGRQGAFVQIDYKHPIVQLIAMKHKINIPAKKKGTVLPPGWTFDRDKFFRSLNS